MKKTAFMFPGQGSQSLKMLDSFKADCKKIQETFDKASESLGCDLWRLAQEGPIEKLNQTNYTQPILLTASVALWELWQDQKGATPEFLAGHSLGEYTAYTCGGSLQFEKAVQLVAKRGSYMQEAVEGIDSAMAAIIGLSYKTVVEICDEVRANKIVAPSSYNTLDQTIISGHAEAVEHAMQEAKEKGARWVKRLSISVPAHCELMKPAVSKLASALENIVFKRTNIPVISNAHSIALSSVDTIKQSLITQLYQPVYWMNNIQYLIDQGVHCFIECGPGQILTGLIRQIAPQARVIPIGHAEGFEKALIESEN